jgi:hypothetical protein
MSKVPSGQTDVDEAPGSILRLGAEKTMATVEALKA